MPVRSPSLSAIAVLFTLASGGCGSDSIDVVEGGADADLVDGQPTGAADAGAEGDGSVGSGTEPEVVATNLANPQLAIANNDTDVYVGTISSVLKVPIDGTASVNITVGGGTQKGLVVDGTNLYWIGGDDLHRSDLDGNSHSVLTTAESGFFLAVNGDYLFWGGGTAPFERKIVRTDKDGTNRVDIVATATSIPWTIVADETHVYWAELSPGTINRANTDGSDATVLATVSGLFAMAVDETHIYFAGKGIYRVRKDGTELTLLSAGGATGMALDDNFVYWADAGAAALFRIGKDGSGIRLLGDVGGTPGAIAVDDKAIYVISQGTSGKLLKFAK